MLKHFQRSSIIKLPHNMYLSNKCGAMAVGAVPRVRLPREVEEEGGQVDDGQGVQVHQDPTRLSK